MKKKQVDNCLKLLQATVTYYSQNVERRCANVEGGGCAYSPSYVNKTGISKGCAIGRIISPKLQRELDSQPSGTIVDIFSLYSERDIDLPEDLFIELDNLFDKYPIDFLTDLQNLHDNSRNWDKSNNTLTLKGKEEVKYIKRKIQKHKYSFEV